MSREMKVKSASDDVDSPAPPDSSSEESSFDYSPEELSEDSDVGALAKSSFVTTDTDTDSDSDLEQRPKRKKKKLQKAFEFVKENYDLTQEKKREVMKLATDQVDRRLGGSRRKAWGSAIIEKRYASHKTRYEWIMVRKRTFSPAKSISHAYCIIRVYSFSSSSSESSKNV